MSERIRSKLTYANVMASLAMFVVLGGGAYAATVLPRNSVGTKQLKKGAVTGAKIKANSVTTGKVKNRSLRRTDFAAGQLPAGAQGPAGPPGPKGDTGAPGPATGPAGGDLTGNYPDPQIAAGAVGSAELSTLEPFHQVGAAGEPPFGTNWSNYDFDGFDTAAFRKDRDGLVHLRGVVKHSGGDVTGSTSIFTLPAGYRPAAAEAFVVASTDGLGTLSPDGGILSVLPEGLIFVYDDSDERFISLSGITFYAGG